MEIKIILKTLIKEHDTTIAKVSKATKIPAKTLYNWLAGSEPKSFTQAKRVSDYFGVSLDYLCFGVGHKQPTSATTKTTAKSTDQVVDTCLPAQNQGPIEQYSEEINAGIFEVVLRRVRKKNC